MMATIYLKLKADQELGYPIVIGVGRGTKLLQDYLMGPKVSWIDRAVALLILRAAPDEQTTFSRNMSLQAFSAAAPPHSTLKVPFFLLLPGNTSTEKFSKRNSTGSGVPSSKSHRSFRL